MARSQRTPTTDYADLRWSGLGQLRVVPEQHMRTQLLIATMPAVVGFKQVTSYPDLSIGRTMLLIESLEKAPAQRASRTPMMCPVDVSVCRCWVNPRLHTVTITPVGSRQCHKPQRL